STMAGLANLHCTAPVPALGPAFPPVLDRVFERVLAKTADARPHSPLAFVEELRAAIASIGGAPPRPRRTLVWSLAAGVLAGAVVTSVIVARSEDSTPAAPTLGAPATARVGTTPAPAASTGSTTAGSTTGSTPGSSTGSTLGSTLGASGAT